jgi:PAS domain-containing protein
MPMNLETQYESLQVAHDLPALLGGLLPVLLAHRGELLAVKDAASGRYVHVNEAMARFLGRPADEVLGHTDTDLLDAPLATALRAARAHGVGAWCTADQ